MPRLYRARRVRARSKSGRLELTRSSRSPKAEHPSDELNRGGVAVEQISKRAVRVTFFGAIFFTGVFGLEVLAAPLAERLMQYIPARFVQLGEKAFLAIVLIGARQQRFAVSLVSIAPCRVGSCSPAFFA